MAASETTTNPTPEAAPSARVVVERPAPGLARGSFAAPPWLIGLLGSVLVLLAALYIFTRTRRLRQK